ncbi:chaperonin 10-like protein [Penicillium chermesinum]|uniref:Chaperonin 10-like protein n=1 Tax=Penicillium chermesinum TaxID=63820 RepID=A0A9W9NGM8_9EURO|nr:chaperonin 10-like protein [Penicillium chermesinum]KAJ5219614.1 chaperonin 10-like protein [Penicillium chermesinum]
MKEAIVNGDTSVSIHDVEIPVPQAGQLLIRVAVTGTNPKDWKMPIKYPDAPARNQGDDFAGYVEALGEGVVGFNKGDRVAAFHSVMELHGSYAEYAIAPAYTTIHLPAKVSFEEAATIPLAAMTAAVGLYQTLRLPLPWNPISQPQPLIVYGGATACGAFAIKFAKLSNIHPLLVVAGRGSAFVETLIDREKGDTIIDYREGDDAVRSKIKAAAGGQPIHYAYDAVGEHGSHENIGAVVTAPAQVTSVLPALNYQPPEGVRSEQCIVGYIHFPPGPGKTIHHAEFGAAFFTLMARGLAQGWFSGHPYEVRPGGLGGLEGALRDLKAGKASATKYVVRLSETEGVTN